MGLSTAPSSRSRPPTGAEHVPRVALSWGGRGGRALYRKASPRHPWRSASRVVCRAQRWEVRAGRTDRGWPTDWAGVLLMTRRWLADTRGMSEAATRPASPPRLSVLDE